MTTRRLAVYLGVAFIAFLAFFLLASFSTTKGDQGTRAAGDYQGASNCQSCHSEEYAGWDATNHANVFEPTAAFYNLWVADGRPGYCLPCHTVGYNKTTIGGYNPALPWNDTSNIPLLGIQCENCHGPDPMNNADMSNTFKQTDPAVCTQCHNGDRNPQYTEWNSSAHARDPPAYVKNLACAKCHEAKLAGEYLSDGTEPTALPANPRWQLTCATCHDPHNGTNAGQLRRPVQDLCGACHNGDNAQPEQGAVHHPMLDMRQGTANVPVPSSQTMAAVYCAQCHQLTWDYNASLTPKAMAGHDFKPRPEACVECHDGNGGFAMDVDQAENTIHYWQASTSNNLVNARAILDDAWVSYNAADSYGFNPDTKSLAWEYYLQANYSASFVEADGSMGAHNFEYANSLLTYANLKAGQVILMLTPGTFSGKVVDASGNPVAGVQITAGGKVWATSAADGTFSFKHAPGSFTFSLVQGGKEVGIAQGSIISGQTTDVQAMIGAPSGGQNQAAPAADQTLQYLTMLLLIVAIVLIIVLMAISRKKPAVTEPKAEKEESQ